MIKKQRMTSRQMHIQIQYNYYANTLYKINLLSQNFFLEISRQISCIRVFLVHLVAHCFPTKMDMNKYHCHLLPFKPITFFRDTARLQLWHCLMLKLKLKLQYFGHLMPRADSWKRPWCWKKLRQEEKGVTADEMVGWHHWFDGREFKQTHGNSDGLSLYGVLQFRESQWDTT